MSHHRNRIFAAVLLGLVLAPAVAHAYIGPGAGFALVSSFLTFVIAFFTAFFAIFTLPIRMLIRALRHKRPEGKAKVKKVIMLGLDGMEPTITEELMARGEMPNFSKLAGAGTYSRLGTATPAMSPVAWSSFATGSDASYHNIFDFLSRDKRTYLPTLSSSAVYGGGKFLSIGPWKIPLKKGGIRFLRRSVSFWRILSDYGIFSTVLRVPITFPPEKINGLILAGMDVPDLRGSMGTFTFYTQSPEADKIGGMIVKLPTEGHGNGQPFKTAISGPASPLDGKLLEIPMTIERSNASATITVGDETFTLKEREYSPWIRLTFKAARNMKLQGIARFYVTQLNGDFGLYVTPIHIDPDQPVMPVTSPAVYSTYLAKTIGPYGTLGLAEDTWALNERVLDEGGWIEQAYLFHEERRKMWFHTLKRLRKGMACVVFDISDRLQHMCFRYLDPNHPANRGKDTEQYKDALYDMYRKMDELLGETMEYVDDDTALFVMSDHGFKTFQRGVSINRWLEDNGFLVYEEGEDGSKEYLRGVDWSKTKAFSVGLGATFINLKGREHEGIVTKSEMQSVKDEIIAGLGSLTDPERGGARAVNRVIDIANEFTGPYRHDGPDLIVGFAEGYRISWDCARGVRSPLIEDNTKSWSGDHCIDPAVVPGILLSNLKIDKPNPSLMDLAPTVLDLFGVRAPAHMVGKTLLQNGEVTKATVPEESSEQAAAQA